MKIFTLAIIYNITPVGLSRQLGISVQRAADEQAKFLALFPVLDRALREVSAYGAIRGYAQLRTGLRRHRARGGRPTPWEVNWLRNTPIQGSASVVFKVAGNRLRLRYQHYGARLILPLHDAYVFECPAGPPGDHRQDHGRGHDEYGPGILSGPGPPRGREHRPSPLLEQGREASLAGAVDSGSRIGPEVPEVVTRDALARRLQLSGGSSKGRSQRRQHRDGCRGEPARRRT